MILGLFKPDNPRAWCGENKKTRLFRDCPCDECRKRADKEGRVEKAINIIVRMVGFKHGNISESSTSIPG